MPDVNNKRKWSPEEDLYYEKISTFNQFGILGSTTDPSLQYENAYDSFMTPEAIPTFNFEEDTPSDNSTDSPTTTENDNAPWSVNQASLLSDEDLLLTFKEYLSQCGEALKVEDYNYWRHFFALLHVLNTRFADIGRPFMDVIDRVFGCTPYPFMCLEWIAVHYSATFIQLEHETGPFSVASSVNISRCTYLGMIQHCKQYTSIPFVKLMQQEYGAKKELYSQKWVSISKDDLDEMFVGEDEELELFNVMELSWVKEALAPKEGVKKLTIFQRFWILEMAMLIIQCSKELVLPSHMDWKECIREWKKKIQRFDFIAISLFFTERYLDIQDWVTRQDQTNSE